MYGSSQIKNNKNKSISTTGAVRVETNLWGHLMPAQFFYNKCITRKGLTLKMKIEVTQYNTDNGAIRWRISTSVKVIWYMFAIAFAISVILMLQICDLENLGNVTEYKIRNGPIQQKILTSIKVTQEHFSLALTVFEIFTFQNLLPWKHRSR